MASYAENQKTKTWLEKQGYIVAKAEINYAVHTGKGVRFVKYDIWGSDWIARRQDGIVFIQQKKHKREVPRGIAQLTQDKEWPACSERWVLWWPRRSSIEDGPEVLIVAIGKEVRVDANGKAKEGDMQDGAGA